jgi:hypothetical protein
LPTQRGFWKPQPCTPAREGKVKDRLIALQEDVITSWSRTLGNRENGFTALTINCSRRENVDQESNKW